MERIVSLYINGTSYFFAVITPLFGIVGLIKFYNHCKKSLMTSKTTGKVVRLIPTTYVDHRSGRELTEYTAEFDFSIANLTGVFSNSLYYLHYFLS
jgi:hypothetical protein